MFRFAGFIVLISVCLFGCHSEFTPKPTGYFRLDTPAQHTYQQLDLPGFPYTFEMPVYGKLQRNEQFFAEKADNPFWMNIDFPTLGGTINLTYKKIESPKAFYTMMDEAFRLSGFHNKKADYIEPVLYTNGYGLGIVIFNVGGNAASRYQFIATDSVRNYVRGALYFDVTPNADSLMPVTNFLYHDIERMLMSMRFR
jgi:gliding motility-associated lipoprotein GldD